MINSLAGVTIVTPDLAAAVAAYDAYLGYAGAGITQVSPAQAQAWGAPGAAGARMAVLHPASGEPRFIRLIEGNPAPDFRPLHSLGWQAAEIIVQDVDRLAERLAGGPFTIIGAPAVLDFDFTDQISAMQIVGLGGEILYLTQVGAAIPGFDLPTARSFVGQLFIMVLGAQSLAGAAATWADWGRPAGPELAARIGFLSAAHGLPDDYRHRLSTIALEGMSLIEIDEFPAGTPPRGLSSIGLPSGIAMVSCHAGGAPAIVHTGATPGAPAIRCGAAGEWIEVLG